MPDYETLDWRLSGGVATIILNRPRAGNALTMQMEQETRAITNAARCQVL